METDIVFVIHDMRGGGAQRVALNLITSWVRQGRRVQVITWLAPETDFFELPKNVERFVVGPKPLESGRLAAHLFNLRSIFKIRRHIRRYKPKAVVSFITVTNIFVILASLGLKKWVVISERNDPIRQDAGRLWGALRRLLYRFADVVTANTSHAVEAMVDYVPRRKLAAVHNPIVLPDNVLKIQRSPIVLNVGRLVPQKNQRLLFEAMALLRGKSQGWRMELIGEGPERDVLTDLAARKNLSDKLEMPGIVADPGGRYCNAGIFVLSSVYEGTPNVLLEAMAHAMPCIVSDSLPGALEYIKDNETGLIFRSGDPAHLGECLLKLIEDPELRHSLGTEARKCVENYSVDIVTAQWNQLLFPRDTAGTSSDQVGGV